MSNQPKALRQALEYITGDDEDTALDPNAIEQVSKLITAIRQHLGETE